MVFENAFTCTVAGQKYVRGELNWNSYRVMYLVECSYCKHQYVSLALNFKEWFRIQRYGKGRCGTDRHFSNICCDPTNSYCYLQAYCIEQVFSNSNDKEIAVNAGAWKVLAIPTAHWCIWNEQYKWFI